MRVVKVLAKGLILGFAIAFVGLAMASVDPPALFYLSLAGGVALALVGSARDFYLEWREPRGDSDAADQRQGSGDDPA